MIISMSKQIDNHGDYQEDIKFVIEEKIKLVKSYKKNIFNK